MNPIKSLIRKPDCHKGDFGHVLIIGGDYGMGGAAIMAAEAACRAGAGKVTVLSRLEHITPLLSRLPNVMTVTDSSNLTKALEDKTVIAIGPGLGKSDWSRNLFAAAMNSSLPKVIDADALNLLAEKDMDLNLKNSVITPHVGEAARLLKVSSNEIQSNRELAVKNLYQKLGAISVLKGKGSLVYGNHQKTYQCQAGNAGMATAGMGDVLTGLIAGLIAQKISLEDAAILGVEIHANAGDLVAKDQGTIGMMPMDLLQYLSVVINRKLDTVS